MIHVEETTLPLSDQVCYYINIPINCMLKFEVILYK